MGKEKSELYGLAAEFREADEVLMAAEKTFASGYRETDAYTPFAVDGLAEALGHKRTCIPLIVLCGGIAGGLGGYFMQWFAMSVDYPLNIGGRPFHSWPLFIPVTFEMTVLGAALTALISLMFLNRLPQPHHPIFNTSGFERASVDRFFLFISAQDRRFDSRETRQFLESLGPCRIAEVEK